MAGTRKVELEGPRYYGSMLAYQGTRSRVGWSFVYKTFGGT